MADFAGLGCGMRSEYTGGMHTKYGLAKALLERLALENVAEQTEDGTEECLDAYRARAEWRVLAAWRATHHGLPCDVFDLGAR